MRQFFKIFQGYTLISEAFRVFIRGKTNFRVFHGLFRVRWPPCYCNSLFLNISRENIFKLQKVQNAAARLILGRKRRDSASMALMQLHWLNIDARISLKLILSVYKVLREQCSDNLKLQYKRFNGRPEDYLMLETPNFKTVYGTRLFEYNGSWLWNALPVKIHSEENVEKFK